MMKTQYVMHMLSGNLESAIYNTETVKKEVQYYAFQNPLGRNSLVGGEDESKWLHRWGAYQMQAKPGGMRYVLIAQNNLEPANALGVELLMVSCAAIMFHSKKRCGSVLLYAQQHKMNCQIFVKVARKV